MSTVAPGLTPLDQIASHLELDGKDVWAKEIRMAIIKIEQLENELRRVNREILTTTLSIEKMLTDIKP